MFAHDYMCICMCMLICIDIYFHVHIDMCLLIIRVYLLISNPPYFPGTVYKDS